MTLVADLGRRVGTGRRRLARMPGMDVAVFVLVGLVVLVAIVGPLVAPATIDDSNILDALQPPSAAHWFGTDQQGRDVLWRVVAGARASVLSSVAIVAGFSVIGTVVATLATLGGRWVDEIVMRFVDAGLAIPPIIFALGVAAALGPSLPSAIIAMIATGWPYTARLLRGIMRETASQPYVESAELLGVSRVRLMARHVLPNSLDVMVVKWAGDVGNTILVLGAMSFVGVAAQPPSAEWGAAVTAAKGDISTAWWPALAPGLAIAITAIAFGLLGDVLRTRFQPDLEGRL
ncbi:ABC transporter permease [Pseudonocardia sp. WMMC193]|uniref:ABC transporter permease n=1 Tax=Pseudonocardia sp. WMMC193 TaxID=2911965 RepID=UPI001F328319|nr:ABC transporter permease [Pseudonocardia sp. WMMC193]MCF7552731.1 ABC transporter permease [Pseudonocardia sp. WMMC193]